MVNAGTEAGDIGYINAHGTGTAKNDAAEFLSLHTLFEGAAPSVSSTKSMTATASARRARSKPSSASRR